jgi:hypothetical protein
MFAIDLFVRFAIGKRYVISAAAISYHSPLSVMPLFLNTSIDKINLYSGVAVRGISLISQSSLDSFHSGKEPGSVVG